MFGGTLFILLINHLCFHSVPPMTFEIEDGEVALSLYNNNPHIPGVISIPREEYSLFKQPVTTCAYLQAFNSLAL